MLALKEERENAGESIFRRCYDNALTFGKSLDIEPDMSRIADKKINPANASISTPLDYYVPNMCPPFLNHLIGG